ncbi:Glycosyltransferase Gtf1 [bioreactor metagenome]|uniref:Glycosyltransferase Gtf1 n=1 Tax=bioreactor metagenome TaxID=1076179 RepID=A0A644W8D4_9ZZZZ|nr:glycosyltransferase [Paludibacter sp.]
MKLLFVIDSLGIGGKERRCLQLIKGLGSLAEFNIHVVIFEDIIEYPEFFNLEITLHKLNRKHRKDFKVFTRLLRILVETKPDIVLSWSLMSSFWLNFIRMFVKFNYLSAYVANTNRPKFFSIGNIARLMSFTTSSYIIGNSNVGLEAYRIPKDKSILIYNGFDFNRLHNLRAKEIIKSDMGIETRFIITMVARVTLAKDYQTFVDAAKLVLKERQDVTFLAVGDGPMISYYKSQLSIEDSQFIKFIGCKQNVEEIILMSDICVLCSESEGISNFILESMALAKPVIATNTGGTPEIVNDLETGFLVEHKNVDQLKTRIIELLSNTNVRERLGNNASEIVRKDFSLQKMSEKYFELFIQFKH